VALGLWAPIDRAALARALDEPPRSARPTSRW
jgi:hypothetical protein